MLPHPHPYNKAHFILKRGSGDYHGSKGGR